MSLAARVVRLVWANLTARSERTDNTTTRTAYDHYDKSGAERPPEPPPCPPINPTLAGYYANLELPYGASREAVRSARRRLLSRYHPDRFANDPNKARLANDLVRRLNHAHDELIKHLEREEAYA